MVYKFGNLQQAGDGTVDRRVDITPKDFVGITLPVYKAMFAHMPSYEENIFRSLDSREKIARFFAPKYYTSLGFARLVAMAGRRLRLGSSHYKAVVRAIRGGSRLILAPNLQQEQVGL